MGINYTSRYGLEFNPFIKNTKDILIETDEYKELVFRLNYLLQIKGFGLVTGNPGLGKTTSIRKWCETLNKAAYKVIYIPLSTLTVLEFYRQLASSLGIEPYHKKVDNFRAIQEMVTRYEKEKRVTLIIILDEANYLKSETLNDLKLLFNFDMDSQDRAVVLLMGLPNLSRTLNLNVHEPLKQRIVMNYQLDSLTKDESKNYILRKLKGAGCHQTVFEEQALEAVVNACNGVPRRINQLCNQCLLIGNNQNKNMIDIDVVMDATDETEVI